MTSTHNMSDEDFLDMGDDALPEIEEEEEVQEEEPEESEEEQEDEEEVDSEDLEDTDEEETEAEVDDTEEQIDDDAQETDETADEETEEESQNSDEDDEEEVVDEEDTDRDTSKPTYEELLAFHTDVTGEYKANGEMKPGFDNPADIKKVFAMAADYAQKTTAIKGHRGRLKMLEGVSDKELNEMMDFRDRNPELIKKAMQEAKLNPMDIDLDEKIQYTAKDHSVSQAEVEFDDVLDGIRNTPTFEKTAEVVAKTWDEKSRQAMMDSPQLIEALNDEMEMGRYDTIQGMISQNRLLGRGGDMSDLEMYQVIATEMNKEAPVQVAEEKPKSKVQDAEKESKRKEARSKASIKQKKAVKVKKTQHDPAKLSDEDFLALMDDSEALFKK